MIRWVKKRLFSPEFQKTKDFLGTVQLFQGLTAREVGAVVKSVHVRVYQEGEKLFEEGDIGRALFILESGKIDLTRRDDSGASRRIFSVSPGGFFGEMSLLEQLPRTASAVAAEKSRLYLVYRSQVESLFRDYPRIGVRILMELSRLLSARLRRMGAEGSSLNVLQRES